MGDEADIKAAGLSNLDMVRLGPEGVKKRVAEYKADKLQKEMRALQAEAVRSSSRLAGLAAGRVTQIRARPNVSGGLAGGGQAQRIGGIQGGRIGGPLGSRGPAGASPIPGA